jgi:hypothetical protein
MTQVFDYLLKEKPLNNKNFNKFTKYLKNYWRSKLKKLCVWDNNIPRTTNIAEGYNNGLETSFDQ